MVMHVEVQCSSLYRSATLLLKAEKSNKLSSNFCPSPFKVVQKTGTEVTVTNEVGEEFRRNTAFIKRHNGQGSVSRPNGKEISSPGEVIFYFIFILQQHYLQKEKIYIQYTTLLPLLTKIHSTLH